MPCTKLCAANGATGAVSGRSTLGRLSWSRPTVVQKPKWSLRLGPVQFMTKPSEYN